MIHILLSFISVAGVEKNADRVLILSAYDRLREIAEEIVAIRECLDGLEDRVEEQLDHRLARAAIPYFDSLLDQLAHLDKDAQAAAEFHGHFHSLTDTLKELMAVMDLEEVEPSVGTPFDVNEHRVVARPDKPGELSEATIAEVTRRGWRTRSDAIPLRPADTRVCCRNAGSPDPKKEDATHVQTNRSHHD